MFWPHELNSKKRIFCINGKAQEPPKYASPILPTKHYISTVTTYVAFAIRRSCRWSHFTNSVINKWFAYITGIMRFWGSRVNGCCVQRYRVRASSAQNLAYYILEPFIVCAVYVTLYSLEFMHIVIPLTTTQEKGEYEAQKEIFDNE